MVSDQRLHGVWRWLRLTVRGTPSAAAQRRWRAVRASALPGHAAPHMARTEPPSSRFVGRGHARSPCVPAHRAPPPPLAPAPPLSQPPVRSPRSGGLNARPGPSDQVQINLEGFNYDSQLQGLRSDVKKIKQACGRRRRARPCSRPGCSPLPRPPAADTLPSPPLPSDPPPRPPPTLAFTHPSPPPARTAPRCAAAAGVRHRRGAAAAGRGAQLAAGGDGEGAGDAQAGGPAADGRRQAGPQLADAVGAAVCDGHVRPRVSGAGSRVWAVGRLGGLGRGARKSQLQGAAAAALGCCAAARRPATRPPAARHPQVHPEEAAQPGAPGGGVVTGSPAHAPPSLPAVNQPLSRSRSPHAPPARTCSLWHRAPQGAAWPLALRHAPACPPTLTLRPHTVGRNHRRAATRPRLHCSSMHAVPSAHRCATRAGMDVVGVQRRGVTAGGTPRERERA